jgi:hypothetical protein
MASGAVHNRDLIDAEIVGARIIDPKIVDGRIVDGRIVSGSVMLRKRRSNLAAWRALQRFDAQHRHTEAIAIAGLGMAFLLIYLL